ncbi:MAG TPA: hypothetical protein VJ246_02470 [Patescibacteria group bacterium]|nr:hypothetical protein [Patescibacteria group bacterium]
MRSLLNPEILANLSQLDEVRLGFNSKKDRDSAQEVMEAVLEWGRRFLPGANVIVITPVEQPEIGFIFSAPAALIQILYEILNEKNCQYIVNTTAQQ